jgi:membrane-associated phospholipid phosphatase
LSSNTSPSSRALLSALLIAAGGPVHADGLADRAKSFASDGAYLCTSPARLDTSDLPIALGVTASLGSALALDRITRQNLFPYSNTGAANSLKTYGDYGQFAGPIAAGAFLFKGWITEDSQAKEMSWELVESFAWASGISEGFKLALGRKRPYTTDDPYEFKPVNASSSFPSGHTTAAFAAAATLSEYYPTWQVEVPSYAAAAAVGFSRIYANQHWGSDVVGGAFLGYGVAYALHKRHTHKEQAWDIQMNSDGFAVVWKF